jgi:hypothetical protein
MIALCGEHVRPSVILCNITDRTVGRIFMKIRDRSSLQILSDELELGEYWRREESFFPLCVNKIAFRNVPGNMALF